MSDRLDRFRYYTQFILPLSYDDSLSYYEVLAKVSKKLNEVIDWANSYRDDLYEYVDQKTLENLTTMRNELAAYKVTVDAQLSDMQNQLNGLIQHVDQLIADFQAQINQQIQQFTADINQKIDAFQQQITNQIQQNEAWVKAQILALQADVNSKLSLVYYQMEINSKADRMYTDSRIDWVMSQLPKYLDVPVISPCTGQLMPLQKALYEIVDYCRVWGISAGQYDLLALTAQQYDDLHMTARQYDWCAWYYLGPYKYIHLCFSEITGKLAPIQLCVHQLWQFQRAQSPTAKEYDDAQYTAQYYDNLDLTAYQYNWQPLPTQGG